MAVKINSFDDIRVKGGQILNKSVLNNAFQMLLQNDSALMNENDFRPNIWECRWWNNDQVSGYATGDVCWRNCVTYRQFTDRAWKLVRNYVNESRDLSGYLRELPELEGSELSAEYLKYYNVISGYYNDEQRMFDLRVIRDTAVKYCSDVLQALGELPLDEARAEVSGLAVDLSSGVSAMDYGTIFTSLAELSAKTAINTMSEVPSIGKLLADQFGQVRREPIFDIGDYSKPIEMYISRYDNNKDRLDVTSAWQPLIFRTLDDFRQFISCQMDELMTEHVRKYHYSDYDGKMQYGDISANFLRFDLQNLSQSSVAKLDLNQGVSEGFDWSDQFLCCTTPMPKWIRKWKSGYVEYGGILTGAANYFDSKADSVITVDLTAIGNIGIEQVYGCVVTPSCALPCEYPPEISEIASNHILKFKPASTGQNQITAYSYYVTGKAST